MHAMSIAENLIRSKKGCYHLDAKAVNQADCMAGIMIAPLGG